MPSLIEIDYVSDSDDETIIVSESDDDSSEADEFADTPIIEQVRKWQVGRII